MSLKSTSKVAAFAVISFLASTGYAAAGVLDPIINLLNDIVSDLSTLVTAVGVLAFIVAIIMMMFGQGNAWKLMVVAFLIVLAANAQSIVSSISGV